LNLDLDSERGLVGYRRERFSTLLPITTHLYSSGYTGVFAELCCVSCGPSKRDRKEEAAQSRVSASRFPCRSVCSSSETRRGAALNALILLEGTSGLKPLHQNPRMSCAGLQRSKMLFTWDPGYGVAQLLLQQGQGWHHTAAFPSPEGFAGFETPERKYQLKIISFQSNISYWTAVVQTETPQRTNLQYKQGSK